MNLRIVGTRVRNKVRVRVKARVGARVRATVSARVGVVKARFAIWAGAVPPARKGTLWPLQRALRRWAPALCHCDPRNVTAGSSDLDLHHSVNNIVNVLSE